MFKLLKELDTNKVYTFFLNNPNFSQITGKIINSDYEYFVVVPVTTPSHNLSKINVATVNHTKYYLTINHLTSFREEEVNS